MFFYNTEKRYNQFSEFLKDKFKTKIYKVTLDAGFSCPNRDGTISKGGCIFCDDGGSFSQAHSSSISVEEQLIQGINNLPTRFKAKKFLSYFQAYTNTYKPVEELKEIYKQALNHPDVIGLSVGTRPDCIDDEKLDLFQSYTDKYHVWIEYGLQSIHEKSLLWINRGHNYDCFEQACLKTMQRNILTCAHIILGLPNESYTDMMETAQKLADLKINGIKIHLLCVLKNTHLETLHKKTPLSFMSEEEYIKIVCDILEILPPETIIHRLAGNGLVKDLVAPKWLPKKFEILNKIDLELEKRNSYQGKFYTSST